MKLADLRPLSTLELPAPTFLYRVQRARARSGSVRVGPTLLPPADLLSGRFDVAGVSVGYFAAAPDTAVYESLCRREATAVSLKVAARRNLLCVQTRKTLTLLDVRMHASHWPVLQSLRLDSTQELAADAFGQGCSGIVYPSAQHSNMHCYALFGFALSTLRAAWTEPLTEKATGNLHKALVCALKGSQLPLVP